MTRIRSVTPRLRVLVFGTFDLLHPGHEFVLKEATKRGDLFVVVARDSNVLRIKGRASVKSETERMNDVQKIVPDATVMLGDPEDFLSPVRRVTPDLILLGYDQSLPPGVEEKNLPGTVERLPAFEPEKHKTSIIRKRQP